MTRTVIIGALTFVAVSLLLPLFAFAQSPAVEEVVRDVCANDGALIKWVAGILGASVGASILANLRGMLPLPLIAIVDAVALNFIRSAADQAKKSGALLFLVISLTFLCAACTGDPTKDMALQRYVAVAQPVASQLACDAQALANITGTTFEVSGDSASATSASVASKIAGIWCNQLAAGAPLSTPVTTVGVVTLPTSVGTVTVPVPASVVTPAPLSLSATK